MRSKSPRKPKPELTDKERHARFVATAREIGASENAKDFDRAFKKVAPAKALGRQRQGGA